MKLRLILTSALLLVVMVFAIQNSETVQVEFLFWGLSLPRSLLIFLLLFVGILIGWFSRAAVRIVRN